MKQRNFNKNPKFLISIFVVIIIAIIYFVVFLVFPKKLEAPNIQTQSKANTFKGPIGTPFVKGPTTPPPGN